MFRGNVHPERAWNNKKAWERFVLTLFSQTKLRHINTRIITNQSIFSCSLCGIRRRRLGSSVSFLPASINKKKRMNAYVQNIRPNSCWRISLQEKSKCDWRNFISWLRTLEFNRRFSFLFSYNVLGAFRAHFFVGKSYFRQYREKRLDYFCFFIYRGKKRGWRQEKTTSSFFSPVA